LERCKTCGREYTPVRTMTYSEYGYCSWECLMNKKNRTTNHSGHNTHNSHNSNYSQSRTNRKQNNQRNEAGTRSKWAQNY
jgi:hypothetical protein